MGMHIPMHDIWVDCSDIWAWKKRHKSEKNKSFERIYLCKSIVIWADFPWKKWIIIITITIYCKNSHIVYIKLEAKLNKMSSSDK